MLRRGLVELPDSGDIKDKMVVKPRERDLTKCQYFPVVQYDKEGRTLKVYDCAKSAALEVGVDASGIHGACQGRQRTCAGYQWRYEGAEPPGEYVRTTWQRWPREQVDKLCKHCGKAYKGVKNSRYCSYECKAEAQRGYAREYQRRMRRPREERTATCKHCGEEFSTTSAVKVYCSDKCRRREEQGAYRARKKARKGEQ